MYYERMGKILAFVVSLHLLKLNTEKRIYGDVSLHQFIGVYLRKKKTKKWVTGISFCRLPKISETPRFGSQLVSCCSGASNEACWGSTAVLWRYYSGLTPVDLSYINAPVFTVKSECTLTWGPSIRPAISCYETCKEHSTGESIKHGQMSAWNTDTFFFSLSLSLFFFFFFSWFGSESQQVTGS